MNSEGGRISQILTQSAQCVMLENLAKAQKYMGVNTCTACPSKQSSNKDIQSESTLLLDSTKCFTYVKAPVVPESVRIDRVIQEIEDRERDPINPNTRFIDYAPTITLTPCPPTSTNANIPKPSTKCPVLLNTPLNPILPV